MALSICVIVLAAAAGISSRLQAQRQIRALMKPQEWPATTMALPIPVTAGLTTDLGGSFLHFRFTIKPGAAKPSDVERQLAEVNFTLRLLDHDGYTILVIRPTTELVSDRQSDGTVTYHLDDSVGCSPRIYSDAATWSVEWEST